MLSWREVVVLNVVPGIVMSLLLFVFLGTLRLGAKKARRVRRRAREHAVAGATISAACPNCSATAALVLLSASSAFRSMTQNALLTFLPVFLAYELGYSPFWVGACMFALQAAGFAAAPIAGHLSDRMGRRAAS